MSYSVRFCNVNDPWARYLIVCVDKRWGETGCQAWTGDWVVVDPPPGQCATSPSFRPTRVLTAVTSSDAGFYYTVEFLDSQGRVVKRCDRVDRRNPCYLEVTQPPPPTPTPTPTPTPPPTPTPTPAPTPGTSDWLIIAILIALLVVLVLVLALLLRRK